MVYNFLDKIKNYSSKFNFRFNFLFLFCLPSILERTISGDVFVNRSILIPEYVDREFHFPGKTLWLSDIFFSLSYFCAVSGLVHLFYFFSVSVRLLLSYNTLTSVAMWYFESTKKKYIYKIFLSLKDVLKSSFSAKNEIKNTQLDWKIKFKLITR